MTIDYIQYTSWLSSHQHSWKDHHPKINRSISTNSFRGNKSAQQFPDLPGQYQSEDKFRITVKELSLITREFYQDIVRGLGQPRPYPDLGNRTHLSLLVNSL